MDKRKPKEQKAKERKESIVTAYDACTTDGRPGAGQRAGQAGYHPRDPVYPHHCFHPGRTAPDAGQVVRRLVCGGHHSVEYRAHFVRVFLQREDSHVISYTIDLLLRDI